MDWEAMAAVGELVGAAAVVITLIYLARQMALSNRLAQAEAWRASISGINTLNAAFGVNPRFDQLVSRVMQGEDVPAFEPGDAAILTAHMVSVANIYEQVFREVRDGVLDRRALDEFFVGRYLFQSPFFRTKWTTYRILWSTEFVDWVERTHDMSLPGADQDSESKGTAS